MVKKLILSLIIISIFIINLGNLSAQSDCFPHQRMKDLHVSVTSINSTQCNITNINTPNNTILINQQMTKNGQTFNGTISSANLQSSGYHIIQVGCSNANYEICRDVTETGKQLSTEQSLMYLIILIIMFGFFILSMYGSIAIPFNNERNNDGEVLKVNWKKYSKLLCIGVTYVSFIWIIFMGWNLSWAYLQMQGISTFFKWIFYLFFAMSFPVFVGIIVIGIISYLHDRDWEKQVNMFGEYVQ